MSKSCLSELCHPDLEPLFWPAERRGSQSAWWGHVPFAHWVIRAARPGVLVELGTESGVSYSAFCHAVLREGLSTRCFAVDTWEGDAHTGKYGDGVYESLRSFHDKHHSAFSTLLRCRFDEALDNFADGCIDLLHMDGLHTYEAVRHDFEAWLPKLSDRAVVLIHDTNVHKGDFGAWRFWQELRVRYPAFEFLHAHGLGVLAVGNQVPQRVAELCAMSGSDEMAALRRRVALLGDRWIADLNETTLQSELLDSHRQLAEWQNQATEAKREVTEWQERAAEVELAGNSAEAARAQIEAELIRLRAEHEALLSSTTWKAAWALRELGAMMPPHLRTLLRRGAKLGWWSITLQLPTKLRERRGFKQASTAAMLPAARPVSPLTGGLFRALGPGPIPTLAETLHRQFEYLEPLRTYPISGGGRRLSIVTDGIDPHSLYGGVGTAIILATLLARHLDAGLRLITRRQEADPSRFTSVLAANDLRWEGEIEFLHSPSGAGDDVPMGGADIFLTTSWWTTEATRRAVDPRRILYLLQEDERSFYPHGDERLRCAEVLSDPELHFIVNSRLLFQHLIEGPEPLASVRDYGIWFEPAFPKTLFYDDRERRARRNLKSFFFYARPKNLRNLYWRGLEAIGAAIEEMILSPDEWRFVFAGREIERIALPCGVRPEIRENLPWAEYAALIRQVDLGLSLMDSPHPSYPPLDLAASGAVVVTNGSGLKYSLASYSENILCVDATVDGLTQGIAQAVEIASNEPLRAANFARNGMLRDWSEAFAPVLQRCTEWIS